MLFQFQKATGKGSGLVTDVSPDGRQLAVVVQSVGRSSTADALITDLDGRRIHTLWSDPQDDRKDIRALWSPAGSRIAWQHQFTGSSRQRSDMLWGRFGPAEPKRDVGCTATTRAGFLHCAVGLVP